MIPRAPRPRRGARPRAAAAKRNLPVALRRLFWDLAPGRLDWQRDRDLIVSRVLASGGWNEARLLRRRLGDATLREWLLANDARGLSPARIRFWELILDLPRARADAWAKRARASAWEDRRSR